MKRRMVLSSVSFLIVMVLAIVLIYLAIGAREQAVIERPLLPVAFEHVDHKAQACTDCHHNFIDDTGGGACYHCHKQRPELALDIERHFHDFCRECHVELRMAGLASGPVRQCALCHH